MEIFQSTRPARGATKLFSLIPLFSLIFQSTRPARGATSAMVACHSLKVFQSTRPARGATEDDARLIVHHRDFNPRAPRGARQPVMPRLFYVFYFNPRAPRGARHTTITHRDVNQFISIHAPREGRDLLWIGSAIRFSSFQSTRPARGATAKVNKFLRTFLQKRHGFQIFLRKTLPFKAFCRLQIGKNFSICGANRCGNFCELLLRTIRSSVLPEGRSACSQNAQFYSHTFSRDNRNADCLFPDP